MPDEENDPVESPGAESGEGTEPTAERPSLVEPPDTITADDHPLGLETRSPPPATPTDHGPNNNER